MRSMQVAFLQDAMVTHKMQKQMQMHKLAQMKFEHSSLSRLH